jgi:hypothetical protein
VNSLKTTNYRGKTVWNVLGFVWVPWAIVMAFFGHWQLGLATVCVFVLGLVDDLLGSGENTGFKGHLKALMKGRVSTGSLKLFGISLVSLLYVWTSGILAFVQGYTDTGAPRFGHQTYLANHGVIATTLLVLFAAASIALTANTANLLDLRPGRTAKAYLTYITVIFLVLSPLYRWMTHDLPSEGLGFAARLSEMAVPLFLACLVPIALTLVFDLREQGMLGDGGANAAGFVAGAVTVWWLPFWAIVAYLGIMLFLNLASEKISYSQVIDNNPLLRKLDSLGRLKTGDSVTDREPKKEE